MNTRTIRLLAAFLAAALLSMLLCSTALADGEGYPHDDPGCTGAFAAAFDGSAITYTCNVCKKAYTVEVIGAPQPKNPAPAYTAPDAATAKLGYVYEFDPASSYYNISPHRIAFGQYTYSCSAYALANGSGYDTVYCCDVDTNVPKQVHYYKRLNLEDAGYYEPAMAKRIRGIVESAYPFISCEEMIANMVNTGCVFHGKLDVGQLVTAVQTSIWKYANGQHDLDYNITQKWSKFDSAIAPVEPFHGAWDTSNPDVAANIKTIKAYLDGCASNGSNAASMVINDITYQVYKISSDQSKADIRVMVQLNAAASQNDDITITIGDEARRLKSGESTAVFDIKGVPFGSEITASLSGRQYLEKGAYFYEPFGGWQVAQSFVGVASGMTPIHGSKQLKIEDNWNSYSLKKLANVNGVATTTPVKGAKFQLWYEPKQGSAVLVADELITDEKGEVHIDMLAELNAGGSYYFVETEAPEGYVLNSERIKAVSGETVTVYNSEKEYPPQPTPTPTSTPAPTPTPPAPYRPDPPKQPVDTNPPAEIITVPQSGDADILLPYLSVSAGIAALIIICFIRKRASRR